MTVATPKFGMGASVLRREDRAFIKGEGRYTDDIRPAGLLHGYVLRSPVAKGRFVKLGIMPEIRLRADCASAISATGCVSHPRRQARAASAANSKTITSCSSVGEYR